MSSIPRFNYVSATTVMENLLKRRWSAVILRHLENGVCSPAEICSRESDLSVPVMNERLRTMQRYNLIARNPVRVQARTQDYRLTPRGQRILRMLTFIEQFDQVEDIVIQTNSAGRFLINVHIAPDAESRADIHARPSPAALEQNPGPWPGTRL